ncbi:Asp-tRNA(Asn)/Glu-tRNA(Gln) amidotransferase GatCAB subunit C [Ktedonosporobacter rubrisoli]|uniref:Asp-tRNA(Asn)/Glu-tRNA(Gln) amidotransferase GatCAB subunit C n=1 Tax=Ktedonosporobacter rubrisoli TaxID=2509675 RepID=A0A4P6JK12_KTERU|nr:molybdopterin-dependent oxidoreductase [Ktedonosporobacter rubrisoli]QBD75383.1 Asp-tRNA(Asn)/Glu-tRNA(Gln) amidotransferase GatCAB subunit C [Ktedonosporobacter rubrisoli]
MDARASERRKITQTASHWGAYKVETDLSTHEVLATRGVQFDPHPSPLQASLPEVVYDSLRIDQPYVREGYLRSRGASRAERGAQGFVPVSWDKALTLVCEALQETREQHGNEAIYGGSYGWASAGRLHHAPSVLKRFLALAGGYVDKVGNHSYGAAQGIMPYILGRADVNRLVVSWPEVVSHTRLLVLFGGAPLKNTQIDAGGAVKHENLDWYMKAAQAGIEVICISPQRSDVPAQVAPEWLPIRPNTDTALMLGLAHTLVSNGLHNQEFLARYCVGYPEFERYLLGQSDNTPKDATWASHITEVPAESIEQLARRMASTRTLINTSWSVQRADHGEQPVWMSIALACLLGQVGMPGGGFSFGFGAINGIALPYPAGIPRPKISLGHNPVTIKVPVGRVTDLLLRPGEQLAYNGQSIQLPKIELIYSAGGNPFHHNTNLNRFLQAWKQPATIIVHEPWWTPPARFADIVLPSTTTMERNDIGAAEHGKYWLAMHQVLPPYCQARNDFDIFSELAERLGFGFAYHQNRSEMQWLRYMYEEARQIAGERGFAPPPFAEFWSSGAYEFPLLDSAAQPTLLGDFRADPLIHPLHTSSGRIELVSEKIRSFDYDDCQPHPCWIEPAEWLGGEQAKRYPLHLLSNQPRNRLHSQLDQASLSRNGEISGREPIYLNPLDARRRGLLDGDVVRVFNDRGAFLAGVQISGELRPGVVSMATGAWYDPEMAGSVGSLEKHGNPNVVTLDKGTSRLAQCSVAQTCLVEVEKYNQPPSVTAFAWPPILQSDPS